jgi:hypothetical protein
VNRAKYVLSENQEDAFNFGFTDSINVEDNWITGGHNVAGCGIILDEASNDAVVQRNVLSNTGQCGIGIASGSNHLVSKNKILNLGSPENVGIYVWSQYPESCEHLTITGNISSVLALASHGCDPYTASCSFNGYQDFGNCASLTEENNTFDNGLYAPGGGPAFRLLNPMSTTTPPPLIPPKPKYCVARSPYSTQNSLHQCGLSSPVFPRKLF